MMVPNHHNGLRAQSVARRLPLGAELEIPTPRLWNAEDRSLQTIFTKRETIAHRVGIRQIRTTSNVLHINDHRGVNRHDSDPIAGPAIRMDQRVTKLRLMQHPFSAIRSGHSAKYRLDTPEFRLTFTLTPVASFPSIDRRQEEVNA